MNNRYTGNNEGCQCEVKPNLSLKVDITSESGVSMKELDFALRFFVYGNPEDVNIHKSQLYQHEGKYYALLNEESFAKGWLFCDVIIAEYASGNPNVSYVTVRCNTGCLVNDCCREAENLTTSGQGYVVKFSKEEVYPYPGYTPEYLTSEELWTSYFRLPELTADRAIADEQGNRITDTYVKREAVANHIKQIYNQQFLDNPPLITEGYITPEMLSEETKQMLENTGQEITNLPDGEDLQSVHGVLKFADKEYNPNSYDGLGKRFVRRNIVNGINTLVQSQVKWANTLYTFRYDHDLQGKTITIPEGCTLKFESGKIYNGTIILNDTLVRPYGGNLKDYIDCKIEGTFRKGQVLYSEEYKQTVVWTGEKWKCSYSVLFRVFENKLQQSVDDGATWENVSDYIVSYFRFVASQSDPNSIGKIQISQDNKKWSDLSPEFTNYLKISDYVATTSALPSNPVLGTIYGVGTDPQTGYELYVYTSKGWVNNGKFTSIAAGVVQETGNSENVVMSQKAVSEKLSELGSKYSISGTYKNNEIQIDTLYWIEGEKDHTNWKSLSVNQTFTFGNLTGTSEILILKENNTLELKSANDTFDGIILLLWARNYNDYFGGVLYDEYLAKKIEDLNGKMEDNVKNRLKNQYIYSISGNYTNRTIQIDVLYYTDTEKKDWGRVNVNNTFSFGELNISSEFLVLGKNNEVSIKPNNTINSDDIILLTWGRGFDDFYDGKLYGEYSYNKFKKTSDRIDEENVIYSIDGQYHRKQVTINNLYWFNSAIRPNNGTWFSQSVNETFNFGSSGNSAEALVLNKNTSSVEVKGFDSIVKDDIILLAWGKGFQDFFDGKLYGEYLQSKTDAAEYNHYTDDECRARFVKEMNRIADVVGMENSVFFEPAGYPNTRNKTTAYDLMKLGVYASGIFPINNAWSKRKTKIQIYGSNEREIDLIGPSDSNFESSYNILGWKPGQSTVYGTNTWIMVVQSKSTKEIYVVGEYDLDENASTFDYPQIKSALDYADGKGSEPTFTKGAICICKLPSHTPSLFANQPIELLYAYNKDGVFDQASTTKVMTLLVASMQHINPNELITLVESDIQIGTGVQLNAGDIISVGNLFLLGMLPSSNTAMYALARHIGKKLLSLEA